LGVAIVVANVVCAGDRLKEGFKKKGALTKMADIATVFQKIEKNTRQIERNTSRIKS
jgi:hypothetical protein